VTEEWALKGSDNIMLLFYFLLPCFYRRINAMTDGRKNVQMEVTEIANTASRKPYKEMKYVPELMGHEGKKKKS
jgi:hypothetical protein